MSYYDKVEQEMFYSFKPINDNWTVYSTYPPHIRKIVEYAAIKHTETDEQGRTIAVTGVVDRNQIRLFSPRL
ncbi:hypothetical protein [Rossellomorea marisflavi]|uniref:hypothetical protein n=1 Tax=Rossellomorea marisflavi TaxID=189381 RepID=UPI0011526311|nr:hypothetical protein [Rossellomorea marisflavi]